MVLLARFSDQVPDALSFLGEDLKSSHRLLRPRRSPTGLSLLVYEPLVVKTNAYHFSYLSAFRPKLSASEYDISPASCPSIDSCNPHG